MRGRSIAKCGRHKSIGCRCAGSARGTEQGYEQEFGEFFLIVGGDLTSYSCCYMKVGTDIENCNKLE